MWYAGMEMHTGDQGIIDSEESDKHKTYEIHILQTALLIITRSCT